MDTIRDIAICFAAFFAAPLLLVWPDILAIIRHWAS